MWDMGYGIPIEADFHFVEDVAQSDRDVNEGMGDLIAYCQKRWPSNVWATLRGFDYDRDVSNLSRWLRGLLTAEPPSSEVQAFWYGLFNPVLANGQVRCGLYLYGSTEYEKDSADWACLTEETYAPKGRYANSLILHQLYQAVAETEVASVGEYMLCLGYAALAVKAIHYRACKDVLLTEQALLPVAVGFDSGDYIVLPR